MYKGRVWGRYAFTRTRLEPTMGWVFKTQTHPICFAGQVKPNLLRSGWVLVGWAIFAIPIIYPYLL